MTEYDEWEDYYYYRETGYRLSGGTGTPETPKLKVGNTLQPITAKTGSGIITKVWDVPNKRKGMYADQDFNYMVIFLTDFGNELMLSDVEVLQHYRVTGIDIDIKGRLQYQIKQLTKVMEEL